MVEDGPMWLKVVVLVFVSGLLLFMVMAVSFMLWTILNEIYVWPGKLVAWLQSRWRDTRLLFGIGPRWEFEMAPYYTFIGRCVALNADQVPAYDDVWYYRRSEFEKVVGVARVGAIKSRSRNLYLRDDPNMVIKDGIDPIYGPAVAVFLRSHRVPRALKREMKKVLNGE